MTESFFGFNAAMPALGAGKAGDFSNELIEAPFDEEIDLHNDETFGDAATGGDWEQEHEKLAGGLDDTPDNNGAALERDPGRAGLQTNRPGARQVYGSREDELEQSLSQLVVDDDDFDGRESSNVSHAGRPIPGHGTTNLDNLFGPSSPAGLFNAEEMVRGETSIWGSPAKETHMPAKEGLRNLLVALQQTSKASSAPVFHDPSIVSAGRPMTSGGMQNAKTLAEIEMEMIASEGQKAGGPRGRLGGGQPFTVNDLEQSSVHGSVRKVPSPPPPGFPLPIGTPPQAHFLNQPPVQMSIPGGRGRGAPQPRPITMATRQQPHVGSPGLSQLTRPPPGVGSPGMGPITILQRTSPPLGKPHPAYLPQQQQHPQQQPHPGMGHPQRVSPISMAPGPSYHGAEIQHQHPHPHQPHPGRTSPVPRMAGTPQAFPPGMGQHLSGRASPVMIPGQHRDSPLAGFGSGSAPSHYRTSGQGSMPTGSPSVRPHLAGPDRPPSPLGPPPFMANTPDHRRMPMSVPHSDPSHLRGPRPGYHNQGPTQALFPNSGGRFDPRYGSPQQHQGPPPPRPLRDRGDWEDGGPRRRGPGQHQGHFHQHPHHFNNHQYNNGGGYHGDGYHGDYHYQHHPRRRYNSLGEEAMDDDYHPQGPQGPQGPQAPRDEYAGLMTKKERDWVIKIQMMQLQTDNPYLDDYYYTSWLMKKRAQEHMRAVSALRAHEGGGDNKDMGPKLVIPHLARVESKAYRPVQFENSLGRVTSSSVHNPRQMIDIRIPATVDAEDGASKEVHRFKELLLDIEKGYDLLLDVDDLEKKMLGLPDDARDPLRRNRHDKIAALHELVTGAEAGGNSNLLNMINIRKGIKLLARLLPLLPQSNASRLVGALFSNLSVINRKEWQSDVLRLVYEAVTLVLERADLETLVQLSADLTVGNQPAINQTNAVLTALQSKFGASVIWCLLNRGAQVYTTQSPLDLDATHQQAWCEFVGVVAGGVSELSKDTLARPLGAFPAVPSHLQRLLDKRTFLTVEDKLKQLLAVTVAAAPAPAPTPTPAPTPGPGSAVPVPAQQQTVS